MTSEQPQPSVVIEDGRLLSESLIWKLQRAFYAAQGPEAWKPRGVPFYVTSNPHIARCYARVFLGALRDLAAVFDPAHPVYVVELAAGSGMFAYRHVKALLQMQAALPALKDLRLRYVMTDFAQSNLDAWRRNQRLAELAEQGVLDFALFDIERDREIHLVHSGETLAARSCVNPLLAVANYAFDSTVQDAFFVKEGALSDAAASVLSTRAEEDLGDPAILARARLRFEARALKVGRYDDPALNRVLERYSRRLNDTCFLLPIGALHAIQTLRAWSDGRLLMLCADKAFAQEEELLSHAEAGLTFHGGSVSMTVNFHALGAYFEELGGTVWHSLPRIQRLNVCALASGLPDLPEARLAFEESVNAFGPAAYLKLLQDIRKDWQQPSLEALAALLRLCAWDHQILVTWSEALRKQLSAAPEALKLELLAALRHVWDNFFPMQEDLAFELAGFCLIMKEPRDALFYCGESLRFFGERALTHFRAGLAHGLLAQLPEAVASMDKALALNPALASAREMKIRFEARLRS
jgi:hypothetical protein